MTKSSRIFESARRRTAARVYELVGRLRILLGPLPHFGDASSPDDLPISFILRRDSPRTTGRHDGRHNMMRSAVRKVANHSRAHAAERRPEARSTLGPGNHSAVRADGVSRRQLSGSRHSNQQLS